jgi:hypothetical protein
MWKRKKRDGKPSGKKERILSLAVAASLLAVVFAAGIYIMNKDTLVLKQNLRVSMMGDTMDFTGKSRLVYDKTSGDVTLKNGNRSLILQGVPVYLKDEDAFIFSRQMIYTNYQTSVLARLNHFARISKNGEIFLAGTGGRKVRELNGGYFFDGKNVYLFLDPVTVSWGDESMELEPMSYLTVFNRQGFYYYSYKDGTSDFVESGDRIVAARSDKGGYTLNMSNDIVDLDIGKSLLLAPDPESFDLLK